MHNNVATDTHGLCRFPRELAGVYKSPTQLAGFKNLRNNAVNWTFDGIIIAKVDWVTINDKKETLSMLACAADNHVGGIHF